MKKPHQRLLPFSKPYNFSSCPLSSSSSPSTVQTKGACLFPLHEYEKIKPLHAKMARWVSDREKEKLPGMRNNAISHPWQPGYSACFLYTADAFVSVLFFLFSFVLFLSTSESWLSSFLFPFFSLPVVFAPKATSVNSVRSVRSIVMPGEVLLW